jgi:hypothetical protein
MTERERTAVLVLRVWTEPGEAGLRARITTLLDLSRPDEVSRTVAGRGAITAAVEGWLDELERAVTPP